MNSVLKEAFEILNNKPITIRSNMFRHTVEVGHGDCSHFVFHNATMKTKKIQGQKMLLIWSEHCGYHAFFCDDLEFWRKYEIV